MRSAFAIEAVFFSIIWAFDAALRWCLDEGSDKDDTGWAAQDARFLRCMEPEPLSWGEDTERLSRRSKVKGP
jgi:hypothetical protein